MKNSPISSQSDQKKLLHQLEERFQKNKHRHENIDWKVVLEKLINQPQKLESIYKMEQTGGEPDVIILEDKIAFVDCSKESPKDRRSFCYDKQALNSRKENKPQHSAIEFAKELEIDILNEEQYRHLQSLEEFDLKTSSWIFTPKNIRDLGGSLFCDRRYNTVFTYHNGASSYYASRGFRGFLII